MKDEQGPHWAEPNTGEKADVDLGDGHSITWTNYEGERVGGIIRHTMPVSEKHPHGYCEGAFFFRGNNFNKKNSRQSPEWDFNGDFEKPTLSPSFLCHCGDHGFVREGKWVRA